MSDWLDRPEEPDRPDRLQKPHDSDRPVAMRAKPAIEQDETPSEELARLLDEAEGHRLRGLDFDSLRRIARLYRSESARLARLRDRGGDLDRVGHLNSLCVRAHGFLYSALPRTRPDAPSRARRLAAALRRTRDLRRLAWSILAIGAVLGFSLVRLDPTALYALMPSGLGYDVQQIDALHRSAEARARFFEPEATGVATQAVFGSYLFSHNTRVGLLAFATGALAGLPTLLLQLYNGIMVGTIAALFLQGEQALSFLAWILPHAVPELTAITLCCAAGLALGRAVALPGGRTRAEALQRAAPDALVLVLASLPLFLAAAWIESFIRESALGRTPRFAVAGAGLMLLVGIGLALRALDRAPTAPASDWIDRLLEGGAGDAARSQPAP